MDNILEKYENIISKDYPLYIDMFYALEEGIDILESTDHTLLLRLKAWPLYYLLTDDEKEAIEIISNYEINYIIVRNEIIEKYFLKKGFEESKCFQAYYDGEPFKLNNDIDIKKPNRYDLLEIGKTYNLGGLDAIMEADNNDDLFAAYKDKKLIGYVGIHGDGSMGMLYVFNDYRNKGYGSKLEKFVINLQLERKHPPYGQVIHDNFKSLSLQKKLNMKISNGYIYWMWKE